MGIVDTGLLSDHPDIRPRLIDAVDFTGEGVEDENGHGTKVGLLLLHQAPDALVISVKALGRTEKLAELHLIQASKWIAQDERIDIVSLSAGIYKP